MEENGLHVCVFPVLVTYILLLSQLFHSIIIYQKIYNGGQVRGLGRP